MKQNSVIKRKKPLWAFYALWGTVFMQSWTNLGLSELSEAFFGEKTLKNGILGKNEKNTKLLQKNFIEHGVSTQKKRRAFRLAA
ncbi:MAG: hypothetical protein ACI4IW_03150 [Oscillospiraceae bacterium]